MSTLPAFLQTSLPPVAAPSTARLQALYASNSAQRLTNPTGYSANSSWWAGIIQECLRSGYIGGAEGDRLVLRADESLLGRLEWDGKKPRGLGGVIETESSSAPPRLHPLPAFLASSTPLHAPASMTRRYIGRPLYWALSQLNPFGGEREVKEEDLWKAYGKGKEYVHVPLVEAAAAKFIAHCDENPVLSYTEALYDCDAFRKTFGKICIPDPSTSSGRSAKGEVLEGNAEGSARLSKKDVEVLVKWLMRDMGVVVTDGTIIKILQPGESVAEHPITEVDQGVMSVKTAVDKVEAQIQDIEKQINTCQAKAKSHLSSSQKSLAMSQLRSKKALEDILTRRIGVQEQLRAVIRSIDEAQNDVDVMRAYSTSTTTLRTLLSNPLLSSDHVEKTTENLAEALADQEEIDQAIRIGGALAVGSSGAAEVDEGELEKELEGLLQEEKEKEAVAKEELAKQQKEDAKRKEEVVAAGGGPSGQGQAGQAVAGSKTSPASIAVADKLDQDGRAQAEWQMRYDAAQTREKEEKARAEVERMKRDQKRMEAAQ